MLILYRIFFATIILLAGCGNPPLLHQIKNDVKQEIGSKIVLQNDETAYLSIEMVSADYLDYMADDLNLITEQRYYRLPGLSFFKVYAQNKGKTAINFYPYSLKIENEKSKTSYYPVLRREYKEKFTSSAYQRFDYDRMYSFYITERDSQEKSLASAFQSILPEKTIKLEAGEAGSQIIPLQFIPGENTQLSVELEFPLKNYKKQEFLYTIERSSFF